MSRKRRRSGDGPKKKRRSSPAPQELPDLPDPRALEGHMRRALGGLAGPRNTRLDQAQELVYESFDSPDPEQQVELAQRALAICPDCADAYVVLAEHAPRRKEALKLYAEGVAAGERALGPQAFERDVGHFWGILETRPYMRARLGLANALWTTGRREEAVRHLQDLLRLNPNDNQGVRYTLAGFLLYLDRDEELARHLEQYPDEGSASWAYTRALLAFRKAGDTPEARQLLREAQQANRHVPDYLLDRKHPPDEPPAAISPGHESEALDYIAGFLASWRATPGAITWLRANDELTRKHQAQTPEPRGPLTLVKKWLKQKLPQEDDVWQADARQLPNPIKVAGEKVRPWLMIVTSRTNDVVLSHTVLYEEPVAASLWDALVQAMQYPVVGEPHRPTEVQVLDDGRWDSLQTHFEEVGIRLAATAALRHLDKVFKGVSEHTCGKPAPGLLDMPGVTAEQGARFFEAAAYFYQQAPWKKVGYEAAIRIECGKYEGSPWYAVLMGQSGLSTGMALYEDASALRRIWRRPVSSRANVRESVATSVLFGEVIDLPWSDVEAVRRYGWKVARPDAYPWILHKERGLSHRPPLAWELELMEACLRAVPPFVQRRPQDDPAREEITVPLASGDLTLGLSWVAEEEA